MDLLKETKDGVTMVELKRFVNGRVVVKVGDISKEDVDAIVNAANSSLMGGGGVDGAIHRAGGPEILAQCREIRRRQFPDGLPTGQAVMTRAGKMLSNYVVHTVGPVSSKGGKDKAEKLADCYRNSLALVAERGLHTVAFPAISTGIYGYPSDNAARVSSKAVEDFLSGSTSLKEVRLVFFSQSDADIFIQNHVFNDKQGRG